MQVLVWMRVPGDIAFTVGVVAFVLFVLKAKLASRRPADAALIALGRGV